MLQSEGCSLQESVSETCDSFSNTNVFCERAHFYSTWPLPQTKSVIQFLKYENVEENNWPAQRPNINPIEKPLNILLSVRIKVVARTRKY